MSGGSGGSFPFDDARVPRWKRRLADVVWWSVIGLVVVLCVVGVGGWLWSAVHAPIVLAYFLGTIAVVAAIAAGVAWAERVRNR